MSMSIMETWSNGNVDPMSPLTCHIKTKYILGTTKRLMYLHEALQPKVVHYDIESNNILLHRHWNAKLSDFGLQNLLGLERSYVTTRFIDLSVTLVFSLLVINIIFLLAFR